jgi:Ca2+-binding RTX toxin-like protein
MGAISVDGYRGVGSRNERFDIGSSDPKFIEGGDGNDFLWPFIGSDRLIGGNGSDVIWASGGDDFILGDAFPDETLLGLTGGDRDMILAGTGNDVAFGGVGNDFINGEDGVDIVDGGPGNDYIIGGLGIDVLDGGNGDDILYGGAPASVPSARMFSITYDWDGITDTSSSSNSTIISPGFLGSNDISSDLISGGAGDDQILLGDGQNGGYGGSGNDRILGGADIDYIEGNDGDDVLFGMGAGDYLVGGKGQDFIFGGAGIDILEGGEGGDQFYISGPGQGYDTILDLTGLDIVRLSATAFGVSDAGKGSAFLFTTTALVFNESGPSFCWQAAFNALWYDPDGALGGAAADLVMVSASGLTPTLSTFFFADRPSYQFDQTIL